ncbi:MAG: N-acetylmuramoyl-L-alanine amidase [Kiritimatiellia bacterium]
MRPAPVTSSILSFARYSADIVFVPALLSLFAMSCTSSHEPAAAPDVPEKGYQLLHEIADNYGLPEPFIQHDRLYIQDRNTSAVFHMNSRKFIFNGTLIWLNSPVVTRSETWSLSGVDVTNTIDPLLDSSAVLHSRSCKTIVLDAGHGGTDSGAIGRRNALEKTITLDIARCVKRKLLRHGRDIRLTRNSDVYVALGERSAAARRLDADVFVSIHANSAHNSRASGIETYTLPVSGCPSTSGTEDERTYPGNTHNRASMLLAYYVHRELLKRADGPDRGIRRARFDVLREAPCPAVLVECGFLSNRVEEKLLLNPDYRDKLAEGIARGILTYISAP